MQGAPGSISEPNTIVRNDLLQIAVAELPWSQLRGKTVLVSGGGGFLAAYLVKALLAASALHGLQTKVVCLVRGNPADYGRLTPYQQHPELEVLQHDVAQPLPAHIPGADFVVHSASQASPRFYGTDPVGTLLANSSGTQNLLEYAQRSRAERFLFFSSGEVYGLPLEPDRPIGERDYGYLDPMQVRSCYAESKRLGETMCAAWCHQYGLHTTVVRPFHTYGPGMALDDGRVFADFVADVVAGRDIVLKSDGLAQRPFCYIGDATLGFLSVLLKGEPAQAYNVANPATEISMRDLASLLAGMFPERALGIRFEHAGASQSYIKSPVPRSFPSIDKIAALGWLPTVGLHEGFHKTVLSYSPFQTVTAP
jgi:nucleoside-diphosphate-sugar epimerase